MKRTILLSASLLILAVGIGSCKKCYQCTFSQRKVVNGQDTLVVLSTELCNKGTEGAGANLKSAIKDIEANGYICTAK